MSINDKERGIQKGLGLEREFNVTIEYPVTGVVYLTQEVRAVNEEDAKEQIAKMLDIKTDGQFKKDLIPRDAPGLRPFNDSGYDRQSGVRDVTIDRTAPTFGRVHDMTASKTVKTDFMESPQAAS